MGKGSPRRQEEGGGRLFIENPKRRGGGLPGKGVGGGEGPGGCFLGGGGASVFFFFGAEIPTKKSSRAPFLTLRVATPSGAPRQQPLEIRSFKGRLLEKGVFSEQSFFWKF